MYVIKNALRCIGRAKGRNVLIGIIALVIAISACIGLSIRQAAQSAKESALEGMSVTASLSFNRVGAGQAGGNGGFDRDQFMDMMGNTSSLSLEEYQRYATAASVQNFYYTLTAYFDGSEDFSPVTTESDSTQSGSGFPSGFPGGGGMPGRGTTGDFTLIGYSSDAAMTDFANGVASILEGGAMFEEGTEEYVCVISELLASYNELSVGDTILLVNPLQETESYSLVITGIYKSTQSDDFSMSVFGNSQDPANRIYMSANALQGILDASAEVSTTVTTSSGRESESKVTGTLAATYCFANTDAYYAFEDEARALGLSEDYVISSGDLTAFENSMAPLETLSTMAGWFLVVILIIGGVILVVLNIFNVRERKYEVGVLTAMGMKKWKVAAQFVCEILVVTMIAVVIGAGVGAVSSVPLTNALLEGQIESQSTQQAQIESSFGRPGNMGNMPSGMPGMPSGMPSMPDNLPEDMGKNPFENMIGGAADYVAEVNSAMNLTVVAQMIGVGLLLTLIASAASVLFIMRYDPLKILSNRD